MIKKHNFIAEVSVFILLFFIVVFVHINLLKPIFELGMSPDDWALLFEYKSLGNQPLLKIMDVWRSRGAYTTHQVFYMGILVDLVGFDYYKFQVVNVSLKILASLSLYPLIYLITKKRSLGFTSTLLYSISYSSVGSFEFTVKGSDYLGILMMNISLIYYYIVVRNKVRKFWKLFLVSMLIATTLFVSTIRIFPLLVLIMCAELFTLFFNGFNRKKANLFVLRSVIIFAPYIAAVSYSPKMILGFTQTPKTIIASIIDGNWHLLLTPFAGLGNMILPSDHWRSVFGMLRMQSFDEYLVFIFGGPIVIFVALTLIIGFLRFNSSRMFVAKTIFISIFLQLVAYFVATYHLGINKGSLMVGFDFVHVYPALIGIYVIVLSIFSFYRWRNGSDEVLLMSWVGVVFAFIFTTVTWMFAPFVTQFSGTSYYLTVAAMGVSVFVSFIAVSFFEKLYVIKNVFIKNTIVVFSATLLIIFSYIFNHQQIKSRYDSLLRNGRSAFDQEILQSKVKEQLIENGADFTMPIFVYFDTSGDSIYGRTYEEALLSSFRWWMLFDNGELVDGCVEDFYSTKDELIKYVRNEGIEYRALCVDDKGIGFRSIIYKKENIYAFKLGNKNLTDITDDFIKEIGI